MKVSDILRDFADSHMLRSIADTIDKKVDAASAKPAPVMVSPSAPPLPDADPQPQPDDKFVPPGQMKLELLKKASGVESIYDDGEDNDASEESNEDEASEYAAMLQRLRTNAGLSPVNPVMNELQNEDPLDM